MSAKQQVVTGPRYTQLNAEQAQVAFEATCPGHTPKIDIRTPADIKAARSTR